MTDINGTGSDPPKKKKFISEKIVKQPMSRAQMAKRCAVLLFMAAVFGVIAAITFTISRPLAEKYIGGSSTEESETISIPKDEETQPAEPLEETEEETTPISELVREAMENYHFDMNTVNNDPDHQYVDIEEADNIQSDMTQDGDPFPGADNVTMIDRGKLPVLVRTGQLRCRLRGKAGYQCFALDLSGRRIAEIPLQIYGQDALMMIDTAQINPEPALFFELIKSMDKKMK